MQMRCEERGGRDAGARTAAMRHDADEPRSDNSRALLIFSPSSAADPRPRRRRRRDRPFRARRPFETARPTAAQRLSAACPARPAVHAVFDRCSNDVGMIRHTVVAVP